jgi:hypothetical protein
MKYLKNVDWKLQLIIYPHVKKLNVQVLDYFFIY